MQSLVIGFLGIGDQFLNTDIFANDIARTVQEQQCQEPAHAAVAVVEGMDTEKVQYKDGNQQQRVKVGVLHGRLKRVAQCVDGLRRFPCRDRLKAGNLLTIRQFFCNDIVGVFVVSSDSFSAEFK